ncbi:hypothetical protein L484_013199 [Morus notabilis]|uniref:Uncharacterized protein n=2 Tax=Morus notabilis TaxID=981085 RepID=W9REC4_9ROSA|nr:hypothetical protein L484_013199 [Morus notabilis]
MHVASNNNPGDCNNSIRKGRRGRTSRAAMKKNKNITYPTTKRPLPLPKNTEKSSTTSNISNIIVSGETKDKEKEAIVLENSELEKWLEREYPDWCIISSPKEHDSCLDGKILEIYEEGSGNVSSTSDVVEFESEHKDREKEAIVLDNLELEKWLDRELMGLNDVIGDHGVEEYPEWCITASPDEHDSCLDGKILEIYKEGSGDMSSTSDVIEAESENKDQNDDELAMLDAEELLDKEIMWLRNVLVDDQGGVWGGKRIQK